MLFDPTKILLATHASNWYLTTSQVQVSTTSLFIGLNVNFSSIFFALHPSGDLEAKNLRPLSDVNHINADVECRRSMKKSRFATNISGTIQNKA